MTMSDEQRAKIEALRYAINVCETRKSSFKFASYNLACDEIKLFLEAAIIRVEAGEDMPSYAYVQSENVWPQPI